MIPGHYVKAKRNKNNMGVVGGGEREKSDAPFFCTQPRRVVQLLYVHRNQGLLGTEHAQDGHLDFHTAPDLWKGSPVVEVLLYVGTENVGLLWTGD